MSVDVTSKAAEAYGVSPLSGETGKFEARVPNESIKNDIRSPAESNKRELVKQDYQVQEPVIQGASQDTQVKRLQALVGWFARVKKALGIREKKYVSQTMQVENRKPRRRGWYTFLYGGRVNLNTFYDYMDQS